MEIKEMLYEGKAKQVFATENPDIVMVHYKDDATAFNGLKKGTITGKGVINNRVTNFMMKKLEAAGIPTHFVEELNDRDTLVKKVEIVPLEVIIRNISAGSFAKRFGVEEGIVFENPTIEYSYKNDDLGDPMINTAQALALKLATPEEIETIRTLMEAGQVVIGCGGGGIPVYRTEGNHLKGAGAVIDKDFASELLAEQLDADALIILTAVEKVAINFRKENEQWLSAMTPEEARRYIAEGQFAPGSMLPKVEAAVKFAESKAGRTALITLLEKAKDGIAGKTGTLVSQ